MDKVKIEFALDAAIGNASRCRSLKMQAEEVENDKARQEFENAEDYFDRAAEAIRIARSTLA
jgi:hypothetical protein